MAWIDEGGAQAPEADGLPVHILQQLGALLKDVYPMVEDVVAESPLGRMLGRLRTALTAAEVERQVPDGFGQDLLATVPRLRRYAWSLARNATEADDLVQMTLLRAWEKRSSFEPGTRMLAWLFTILRNGFYNGQARLKREVSDIDGLHAGRLRQEPDQIHRLNLADLQRALDGLDARYREPLLLATVDGLSVGEVAAVLGCPAGTVKSRVSRARDRLVRDLGDA